MRRLVTSTLILAMVSFVSCQTYETTISRRERNLDHWDAETLAAYLGLDPDTAKPLEEDTYVGIDAAVMFYAQWCSNCHRFATVWDTIGQLLHAGTTESNLVMALFNCELNQKHTQLCDAAGVTHYPTLMFVGAGPYHDSDPITSAIFGSKASGPYGVTMLPRTVKFQGNLNIGDSVLDWVKTMRGLSTWYKWNHMEGGWLKGIRSLFSNPFRQKASHSKTENALPVGIPTGFYASSRTRKGAGAASSTSTYALEKQLKTTQEKLDAVQNQLDETQLATTHAGYLIDSFLFPVTSNSTDTEGNVSKVPVDIFSIMNETGAWDAPIHESTVNGDDELIILKSCMVDLTLDYCTRFSSKTTIDYLDGLVDLSNSEYPTFIEMEKQLQTLIEESEPYCAKFSNCYENGFLEREGCRPVTCPFQNEVACRYVAACMSKSVQDEYRDALQKNALDAGRNIGGSET